MKEKKDSEGLEFILKLNTLGDDEKRLVQMAKEAIEDEKHDKRTFLERKNRDMRFNPYGIAIGNAIASGHAIANSVFTAKDKLYMIINKYINLAQQNNPKISKDEALEKFCRDFAAAYPKEYGIKKAPENIDNMQMKIIKQSRINTQ